MKALCKGGKVSLRFTHLQRQYVDACIGICHEIGADIPNECFSRHFDRGIVGIRKALPVVRRFQIPVERLRSLREYTYQKPVDIFVFIGGKGQSPFSETNDVLQKPQEAISTDHLRIITGVDPDP